MNILGLISQLIGIKTLRLTDCMGMDCVWMDIFMYGEIYVGICGGWA